jgi:hypothetical protein
MPKAELFARIDAVDAATVKAVANRFILDQDVAISAMGDTQVGGWVGRCRGACSGWASRLAALFSCVWGWEDVRLSLPWGHHHCWLCRVGGKEQAAGQHLLMAATHPPHLTSACCPACLQFLPDYTWMRRRTYWLRY